MTMTMGKEFVFLLSELNNVHFKDIVRLAKMGMRFVVIDIDKAYKSGVRDLHSDIVHVTTTVNFHGMWKFERRHIDPLVFSHMTD